MTFQVRESLTHRGQERPIWGLPLDPYFNKGKPSPFVAPPSNCWRGYVGTWEIRNDALHLVAIEGSGKGWMRIGLDELFPGHAGSVEATWFSGEITPDDVVLPEDNWRIRTRELTNRPVQFLWFILIIHRGQLLLEESIDLKSGAVESRLTRQVERLFSDQELVFLQAVRSKPDGPALKLIYADWLEERGDARSDLLRSEVECTRNQGYRRRSIELGCSRGRQDIASGHVDPNDMAWFWRQLVGIPG